MYALPAFLPLFIMIRSDFRERQIGVVWLILFGLLAVAGNCLEFGWREFGFRMLVNGTAVFCMAAVVWLYLRLRYGTTKGYIGWGDLWFLACLTPLFGLRELVGFLTISFVLTLAVWWMCKNAWTTRGEIPLVGTVGLCYIGYVCLKLITR
ncbi:MAG: hypothetical protein LBR65_02045 [Culturomica sp.]|jgi:hypothetical protein|nr:hypothetical protein [Culturomica sp.]